MTTNLLQRGVRALALVALFFSSAWIAQAQDVSEDARIAAANRDYEEAARLFEEALKENPEDEGLLLEAGDVYMALEQYGRARDLYQLAYNQDSRDCANNMGYGIALSKLGEHAQAIDRLRQAMKLCKESLDSRLSLADALIRADSINAAEFLILKANNDFENSAPVKIRLGDIYFARNVYTLAENYYREALDLDEELTETRARIAEIYFAQANRATTDAEANELYGKAAQEFYEVTRRDPKNAQAWRRLGELLVLAQKYDDALTSFDNYIKLRPNDPMGDILFARAASKGKYFQLTVEPAQRILARTDDESRKFIPQANLYLARGFYARAQIYVRDTKRDSAALMYDQSSSVYAQVPDSLMESDDYIFFGNASMQVGDTARGAAVWKQVVINNPDSCTLAFRISNELYAMKRYADVIEIMNRYVGTCQNQSLSKPYLLLGLATYAGGGNDSAAIDALNKSIAADSTDFAAYYWLMNALAKNNRLDDAATIFQSAVATGATAEAEPEKVATGWYFSGRSKFLQKDYKGTISDMDKALELDSDFAYGYLFKGLGYHALKDKAKACENYRKALQYDPGNQTAKDNLANLGC